MSSCLRDFPIGLLAVVLAVSPARLQAEEFPASSAAAGAAYAGVTSGGLSGFDCLIEPHAIVDVSTRQAGILEEIIVKRGDVVKKGQVLARLESRLEEIAVELTRARTKMSANLESRRSALGYLKRQRKRIEELYQKKAIPFHEKDKAETDVILAEMELRDAQDNMKLAEIEHKRAEQVLAKRTIRSPVNGVVVKTLIDPGESVEDRPIVTVAQVDPLNVEVILPVEQHGVIKIGTEAEVTPLIRGGAVRRARVTVVDRVIDAASNTYGVRLELPNPEYAIPGGIRCEIRFLPSAD